MSRFGSRRNPALMRRPSGVAPSSGVALPTTDLRTALDARDAASLTLDVSDYVEGWDSTAASGAPVDWSQATAANRPEYVASAGALAEPAVAFGGLATQVSNRLVADTALLASSGPITAYALIDNQESSAAQALLDAQTGRRILSITTTGSVPGYFDGTAYRGIGANVSGVQCLTWVLQTSGGELWRARSSIGTDVYTEGAWGGSVSLGTVYNAFSGPDIHLYGLFVYGAAHGASERAAVWDYIAAEWGAGTGL